MIKPRIKKIAVRTWSCARARVTGKGSSWRQAYDRWLIASIKEAMAGGSPAPRSMLTASRRNQVTKAKGQKGKKSKRKVVVIPKHVNKPPGNSLPGMLPIARAPKPRKVVIDQIAPGIRVHRIDAQVAEQPEVMHQSDEGREPERAKRAPPEPYVGTAAEVRVPTVRRAYKSPVTLLLAAARAAAHQPHLISISTAKNLESNV